MECKVNITARIAGRLKKQLGTGGSVDCEQVSGTIPDNNYDFRIKVFHIKYKEMIDKFFDKYKKIQWTHNGKPIKTNEQALNNEPY